MHFAEFQMEFCRRLDGQFQRFRWTIPEVQKDFCSILDGLLQRFRWTIAEVSAGPLHRFSWTIAGVQMDFCRSSDVLLCPSVLHSSATAGPRLSIAKIPPWSPRVPLVSGSSSFPAPLCVCSGWLWAGCQGPLKLSWAWESLREPLVQQIPCPNMHCPSSRDVITAHSAQSFRGQLAVSRDISLILQPSCSRRSQKWPWDHRIMGWFGWEGP